MRPQINLEGRIALITGAASGIGLAALEQIVALGARVLACDQDLRKLAPLVQEHGPAVRPIEADVVVERDVISAVDHVVKSFGRIDILVNSAGIADVNKPTVEQDLETWQRIVDVNLRGTYLTSREVGRTMVAQGSGSIINIASVAGMVSLPRRNAYSAAKAGVITMTRSMAAEWGPSGVRVNAVAPGYIRTPMTAGLDQSGTVRMAPVRRRTPLGRMGEVGEVAALISFLASDLASYITGACIPVDGGWAAFGDAGDTFPE